MWHGLWLALACSGGGAKDTAVQDTAGVADAGPCTAVVGTAGGTVVGEDGMPFAAGVEVRVGASADVAAYENQGDSTTGSSGPSSPWTTVEPGADGVYELELDAGVDHDLTARWFEPGGDEECYPSPERVTVSVAACEALVVDFTLDACETVD